MSRTSQIFVLATLAFSVTALQGQKRGTPPSAISPGRSSLHSSAPVSRVAAPTASSSATTANVAPANTSGANAAMPGSTVTASPATVSPRPLTDVPENATVITLHGLCSSDAANASDPKTCAMTISRDQFEDVLSAVSLGGQVFTAGSIRNVADTYVQNLVLADAAIKSGVDKDPRVQKLLELVRARTLAEAYRHAAEEKYRNPPPDEIEKYYRANLSRYQAVKTERILIPKFNPKAPKDEAFLKKAETLARELRERAAQGEPADKLQNEAFIKLGIPAPAFLPENGLRRRASFPVPDIEHDVFTLKPGEVTKVENEASGFTIYRLITKDTWTVEQVRGEIVRDIFRQKMEADVKGTLQSVQSDLNQQYFAPAAMAQPPALLPTAAPGKSSAPGTRIQSTHSVKLPPATPSSTPPAPPTPK